MKRKILILTMLLMLFISACGSSELDSFTEDFNQSSRKYDTAKLVEDEFGEIEYIKDNHEEVEDEKVAEAYKNSDEGSRELFSSKEYSVEALYEKKDLRGYYIKVDSDDEFIDKDGDGYNAVLTFGDALGIDIKELEKGMQKAFNEDTYEYEDSGYDIRISVMNIDTATMFIYAEFE